MIGRGAVSVIRTRLGSAQGPRVHALRFRMQPSHRDPVPWIGREKSPPETIARIGAYCAQETVSRPTISVQNAPKTPELWGFSGRRSVARITGNWVVGPAGVGLTNEINGLGRPTPSNRGIDFKRQSTRLSNPISAGYRRVFHQEPPKDKPVPRRTGRDAPTPGAIEPNTGQPRPLRAEVKIPGNARTYPAGFASL